MRKVLPYLLCLALLATPFGCSKKETPTGTDLTTVLKPTVTSFMANPDEIGYGETSTLSWVTSNATTVSIDQGIGTVAKTGSIQVTPEETTTYTLTATNSDGSVYATCTVTVRLEAYFELTSYSYGYTGYGNCNIIGIVTNTGNAPGYNVMISFQAYIGTVIVDTANGFPANLGTIYPGLSAAFEAIFFQLTDWSVITAVYYEITWITGTGVKKVQTGIVPKK